MTDKPKMHHYVPVFYLAGFTPSGNRDDFLWVFDTSKGSKWKTKPEKVGKEKDFYKIQVDDFEPYIIERIFRDIESEVAPILKGIITNKILPKDKGLDYLLKFIALLAQRTPGFLNVISNFIKDLVRKTTELTFSTKEGFQSIKRKMKNNGKDTDDDMSYEELKEFVFSDRYDIQVNKNYQIAWILKSIEMVLPLLRMRKWSLIFIDDSLDDCFICSDRPVSLTWLNGNRSFFSPGFGLKETLLLIPINKRIALLGLFEGSVDPIVSSITKRKALANFNSRIGGCAERFIYFPYNEFIYLKPEGDIGTSDYLMDQYRKKHESNLK